jgi:hypothetical protein
MRGGVRLLLGHFAREKLQQQNAETPYVGVMGWFPQTLQAGWKYWGYVVPDDFMARMNMTQFVQGFAGQGIRVMVFTLPEKALAWLETI